MKIVAVISKPKALVGLVVETFKEWRASNTPRLGAALAYYSVFAIAPLFLLTLSLTGLWFGQDKARQELFGQLQQLVGEQGGKALEALLTSASNNTHSGVWAACVALVTLAVTATGVFVELQDDLNLIWRVEPPRQRRILDFVKARLLSFAMIVGIGFLLLVSLVFSAALAAFGAFVTSSLQGQHLLWAITNFIVSLGVISFSFAAIFKFLPDVKIGWKDVWIGGVLTAGLFNFGKFLLGFYLGRSSMASAYGAAGSLVIILVWVYYSAQILFFGAEFTRVYAMHYGSLAQKGKGRPTATRGAHHLSGARRGIKTISAET